MRELKHWLGIEIGGTKLQIVVGEEDLRIVEQRKFTVEKDRGASGIRAQIERALIELKRETKSEGVGVGFGGPVDWRTGRICRSHQIEGWSEFDLCRWLQDLTGTRVRVDNDANVAALGESIRGAGSGLNPAFYVTLGSGVGGGLVVNGEIFHGAVPGEAEIGHVRLDRGGTTLESRCSGWAIDVRIREAIAAAPTGPLARLVGMAPGGEARHLTAALAQGDATARQILVELAEDLAFGLSHVVHLIHPQVIILGGGLSSVGETLRAAVVEQLPRFTMEAFQPGPRVVLAGLGEAAVPIGALALAQR